MPVLCSPPGQVEQFQVFIDQRIKLSQSQVWGLASKYSEKSRNHGNSILQSVLKARSHPCAPTPRPALSAFYVDAETENYQFHCKYLFKGVL